MARPAHTVTTWSGTIGSGLGVEEFSCSLRSSPTIAGTEVALSAAALTAAGAWAASDGIKAWLGNNVTLRKTTVAKVGADGHWLTNVDGSYQKGESLITEAGVDVASPYLPAQAALCFSLTTARPGATGKGRVFIPLGRATLDANGRMNDETVDYLAGDFAIFVDRVSDACGQVVVASSKGYLSAVTGVRVGRVIDTIRSRRRDIPEEYETAAIPS